MKSIKSIITLLLIISGATTYAQDGIIKSGNMIVYNTNVPAQKVWKVIGAVDGV